ncbi:MAG: ice-binding family protein, partial [Rubrivivax sp.]|nr:ice-binding family protein [Rubrivivax sp.]
GALGDTTAPTVLTINPADGSTAVCLSSAVSVTFSEPMNPATINTTTVRVTDGGVAVAGALTYDAASRVASFMPTAAAGFAPSRNLVVTVVSGPTGVQDLAGNSLAADRVSSFTTGTQACVAAINLRSAASFGAFGGNAGVTNQGINTVVNGNIGSTAACTLITGLHDATNVYTETPLNIGAVNGSIYCAPPAPGTTTTQAIATQARADAQTAYNTLAALPPGSDPGAGQLGGLTLPAATYTAAGGTFAITSGDLTLDAQGNPNAVWVFQSASALTVGLGATPRRVILINGAQARNVFWQVGSAARIEDGSTMVGTIIAPAGVTVSTAGQTAQTTLIGRAIGLIASVTLVNTTIVAP